MANITGRDSFFGQLTNDLNRFGQDVTGQTARAAANKAANAQELAQQNQEKSIADKKKLDDESVAFKKERVAQKQTALKTGGRAGTLLNGTTGVPDTAGPSVGVKTLLGQ